ncbi:hypothetical protein [Mycolicibacterium sphagni]|uniref:hypothetical protein n=1 Tax=Mycolicibacterium sphagni TaxID=1786 RepID=UPI0021F39ACB|nr:hypothetical protein [Mycolicibacterium sphagni]MCV7174959.1 hypothetical protein [Mycolicibacterium sphagni]
MVTHIGTVLTTVGHLGGMLDTLGASNYAEALRERFDASVDELEQARALVANVIDMAEATQHSYQRLDPTLKQHIIATALSR